MADLVELCPHKVPAVRAGHNISYCHSELVSESQLNIIDPELNSG